VESHVPKLVILSYKRLPNEALIYIVRSSLLGASDPWNWVLNDAGDARNVIKSVYYMVVMVTLPVTE